jgi:hypothetical protein
MDRTEAYREAVKRVVLHYEQFKPSHGDIRMDAVCDDERGRYALAHAGWNLRKRVHGMVLYVRVEAGKVHVEYDGVGEGIYDDLLEAGIPEDDIVLEYLHEQPVMATA